MRSVPPVTRVRLSGMKAAAHTGRPGPTRVRSSFRAARSMMPTEPRIAAVMLFSQEQTVRGEEDMARMTHALIERVLALDGTYYLPYRPHASLAQLSRGYPRAAAFAARKRELDPNLLFRNQIWDGYFSRL